MLKRIFFILFLYSIVLPQSVVNQLNLAIAFYNDNKIDKAIPILENVLKQDPYNYQAYDILNDCYLRVKNYDKSRELIKKFISNKNDIENNCKLAVTEYLAGNDKLAFDIWNVLKKRANNISDYYIIANSMMQLRINDKAIEVLKEAKVKTNDINISYELARLYYQTMNYRDMVFEYLDIYKKNPQNYNFVVSSILNYASTKYIQDIVIKTLEEINSDDKNILTLLNRLYIAIDDYNKALNIAIKLDKLGTNDGTELLNFANRCYALNKFKFAYLAYENYINKYPKAAGLQGVKYLYYLSQIKILDDSVKTPIELIDNYKIYPSKQQYLQIVNQLEKLTEGQKDNLSYTTMLEIAKIYSYILNDYNKSNKYCDDVIKNLVGPIQINAYYLKIYNTLQLGDFKNAKDLLIQILNSGAVKATEIDQYNFLLGRIELWQGNFTKSMKIFDEISDNKNSDYANDALTYYTTLSFTISDSLSLLNLANIDYYLFKGICPDNEDKIIESLQKIQNPYLRDAIIYSLAKCFVFKDKVDVSVQYFTKLADNLNIFQDESLYILGDVYLNLLNDKNKAKEYYNKILGNFPNSLYIRKSIEKIKMLEN